MLPDRVSNPGPLTYESGALPIALRGPALTTSKTTKEPKQKSRLGTASNKITGSGGGGGA